MPSPTYCADGSSGAASDSPFPGSSFATCWASPATDSTVAPVHCRVCAGDRRGLLQLGLHGRWHGVPRGAHRLLQGIRLCAWRGPRVPLRHNRVAELLAYDDGDVEPELPVERLLVVVWVVCGHHERERVCHERALRRPSEVLVLPERQLAYSALFVHTPRSYKDAGRHAPDLRPAREGVHTARGPQGGALCAVRRVGHHQHLQEPVDLRHEQPPLDDVLDGQLDCNGEQGELVLPGAGGLRLGPLCQLLSVQQPWKQRLQQPLHP